MGLRGQNLRQDELAGTAMWRARSACCPARARPGEAPTHIVKSEIPRLPRSLYPKPRLCPAAGGRYPQAGRCSAIALVHWQCRRAWEEFVYFAERWRARSMICARSWLGPTCHRAWLCGSDAPGRWWAMITRRPRTWRCARGCRSNLPSERRYDVIQAKLASLQKNTKLV